jgi:hypothetical protein
MSTLIEQQNDEKNELIAINYSLSLDDLKNNIISKMDSIDYIQVCRILALQNTSLVKVVNILNKGYRKLKDLIDIPSLSDESVNELMDIIYEENYLNDWQLEEYEKRIYLLETLGLGEKLLLSRRSDIQFINSKQYISKIALLKNDITEYSYSSIADFISKFNTLYDNNKIFLDGQEYQDYFKAFLEDKSIIVYDNDDINEGLVTFNNIYQNNNLLSFFNVFKEPLIDITKLNSLLVSTPLNICVAELFHEHLSGILTFIPYNSNGVEIAYKVIIERMIQNEENTITPDSQTFKDILIFLNNITFSYNTHIKLDIIMTLYMVIEKIISSNNEEDFTNKVINFQSFIKDLSYFIKKNLRVTSIV